MKYFCPECRNKFELKGSYAGKRINCSACGINFDVGSRIMELRKPGPTLAEKLRQSPDKLEIELNDRLDTYWRNWGNLFGDILGRPPKSKFLDVMDLLDVNYGCDRWRNCFQEYQLIEETTMRLCRCARQKSK